MTTRILDDTGDKRTRPSPQVWGYLHSEGADEIEIAAWRYEIAGYCRDHGLKLVGVHIDRRIPSNQIVRPGFAALLEVLELPTSHGVVVPHIDLLSKDRNIRALLASRIEGTASHLILMEKDLRGSL